MTCPTCGTENEAGRKFCGECGSALAAPCPACAAPNAPGTKFCGECGASLVEGKAATAPEYTAERRLVSVLFVDLVGFTAASESRDAEETRELLTRYFELAQTTICWSARRRNALPRPQLRSTMPVSTSSRAEQTPSTSGARCVSSPVREAR